MDDYLREGSPAPAVLRRYGIVLTAWQKYDDARAAVARADSLDAGDPVSDYVRWAADVLEGKWAEADAIARRESQLADSQLEVARLGRRRHGRAVRREERRGVAVNGGVSRRAQDPRDPTRPATARAIAAAQLLALGRPAEALAQAERGLKDAKGGDAEWGCLYFLALAQSRTGRTAEAAKTIDMLTAKANAWPSSDQMRAVHATPGRPGAGPPRFGRRRRRASSGRSDAQAAWPLGRRGPAAMDLVRIFGSALLAAGRDDEAAARFQLIVDRSERVYFPLMHVRSLYFLAQIAERRGDRDKAREYYQRFVDLWGNGDIDRERVAEARKKLAMK